jgi:hypothetical protein
MPNHVTNILRVWGEDSSTVFAFIKTGDNLIDFQKIIPMPDELRHIQSPVKIVPDAEYDAAIEQENMRYLKRPETGLGYPLTQTMSDCYKAKFGADNWYDWRRKNWGTKWGAYSQNKDGDSITFQTAWSTPTPIVLALSRRFPKNSFEIFYADEDFGSNLGRYVCKIGAVLYKHEFESRSPSAMVFAGLILESRPYCEIEADEVTP